MYCVKCGVKLADTEKSCPLCQTAPGTVLERSEASPLYPPNRYPDQRVRRGAVNGAILFLFLIPVLVTFFVDLQANGRIEWCFYVAGAVAFAYVVLALPLWFRKPNPVIFVPCGFAAAAAYLLLICLASKGSWYLGFALPVTGSIALIVTAVVTLLRYVKKGRLYILGGAMIALGGVMLLMEFLMTVTFSMAFSGWSVYPLIALSLLGGLMIFLAINGVARERMERKFFF